ncbi:hypothetical protein SynRS9907_02357 [Synechococcus sp. RS9907]|nr:hypothetical protein SynRS9907_02357 [Synechococcus sp. RS9907]
MLLCRAFVAGVDSNELLAKNALFVPSQCIAGLIEVNEQAT